MIRTVALAVVGALMASCAPTPYQAYDSNGYPVRQQGGNPNDVATIAAVGLAGLAAYGYMKERKDRKKAEDRLDRYQDRNRYYNNRGYGHYPVYGDRGNHRHRGYGRH